MNQNGTINYKLTGKTEEAKIAFGTINNQGNVYLRFKDLPKAVIIFPHSMSSINYSEFSNGGSGRVIFFGEKILLF